MRSSLQFVLVVTLAMLTLSGCSSLSTAKKLGSEARAYQNLGWIKVIENDQSPMSGYQRLMDELSINPPTLEAFIDHKGLPAYLRVTGGRMWGYDLAYCEEGKIYRFGGMLLKLIDIYHYSDYRGVFPKEMRTDFSKCSEGQD